MMIFIFITRIFWMNSDDIVPTLTTSINFSTSKFFSGPVPSFLMSRRHQGDVKGFFWLHSGISNMQRIDLFLKKFLK